MQAVGRGNYPLQLLDVICWHRYINAVAFYFICVLLAARRTVCGDAAGTRLTPMDQSRNINNVNSAVPGQIH